MCKCLTCDADRRLEVWGSRQGHRGHSEGVHLGWGLHRGRVLCRGSEVDLIIEVVLKLLHQQKWVRQACHLLQHYSAYLSQPKLNSQTLSFTIHPYSVFIRYGRHGRRWSGVCLATCLPGLSPWSWSPFPCSRSHSSLTTPPRPQAPSVTPPGTGRETLTTCPLCFHLKWEKQRENMLDHSHVLLCSKINLEANKRRHLTAFLRA